MVSLYAVGLVIYAGMKYFNIGVSVNRESKNTMFVTDLLLVINNCGVLGKLNIGIHCSYFLLYAQVKSSGMLNFEFV